MAEQEKASARAGITVFVIGVVMVLGGAFLTYQYGYVPYNDALHNAPGVTLSVKGLMVGPLSAWLGIVLLCSLGVPAPEPGGGSANNWRTVLGAVVLVTIVLAALAGVVAYFWLRSFLKGHGYDV